MPFQNIINFLFLTLVAIAYIYNFQKTQKLFENHRERKKELVNILDFWTKTRTFLGIGIAGFTIMTFNLNKF